jgi:hypothetical protein
MPDMKGNRSYDSIYIKVLNGQAIETESGFVDARTGKRRDWG